MCNGLSAKLAMLSVWNMIITRCPSALFIVAASTQSHRATPAGHHQYFIDIDSLWCLILPSSSTNSTPVQSLTPVHSTPLHPTTQCNQWCLGVVLFRPFDQYSHRFGNRYNRAEHCLKSVSISSSKSVERLRLYTSNWSSDNELDPLPSKTISTTAVELCVLAVYWRSNNINNWIHSNFTYFYNELLL